MRKEIFISVDIESSGPIPGVYSMLSLGACVVDSPESNFYVELQPTSEAFIAEALRVTGFSLDQLKRIGRDPKVAMAEFKNWIIDQSADRTPVFVGFNAGFDWSFVNWYFHTYVGENPFGFAPLDIKAYYMGYLGCSWAQTTSSQLRQEFRSDTPHTHNALLDAKAQASIFAKLLKSRR